MGSLWDHFGTKGPERTPSQGCSRVTSYGFSTFLGGRSPSHPGGHRFEPVRAHQRKPSTHSRFLAGDWTGVLTASTRRGYTHSGIRSLFHQNFVKTNLICAELGHLYDKLFDNRQKGDYADLVRFDVEEVSEWYGEAREFVETVEKIFNKEL